MKNLKNSGQKTFTKALSVLLTVLMLMSFVPATVFADASDYELVKLTEENFDSVTDKILKTSDWTERKPEAEEAFKENNFQSQTYILYVFTEGTFFGIGLDAVGETYQTVFEKTDLVTNENNYTFYALIAKTPVSSISLNPTEKTLNVGETFSLIAMVQPSDATNKQIIWRSTSEDVARVIDENGTVEAVAPGTAEIYAISAENSEIYKVCKITVPEPPHVHSWTYSAKGNVITAKCTCNEFKNGISVQLTGTEGKYNGVPYVAAYVDGITSKIPGAELGEVTYSGTVEGKEKTEYKATATAPVHPGTYKAAITLKGTDGNKYTAETDIVIEQFPVKIVAANVTKHIGDPNPEFSMIYTFDTNVFTEEEIVKQLPEYKVAILGEPEKPGEYRLMPWLIGTYNNDFLVTCISEGRMTVEDHNWDEGKVTTPPTDEKEGVMTHTCTVCGATKTEPIEKSLMLCNLDPLNKKEINVDDARFALRIAVKLEKADALQKRAADADGDGEISVGDARLILRLAVKLEKKDKLPAALKVPESVKAVADFYKDAVEKITKDGAAGYTKKEYQTPESFVLTGNEGIDEKLNGVIAGFITKKDDAKDQVFASGSKEAKDNFPAFTLTDYSKIASANCSRNARGNYDLEIIMKDEDTPKKADSFLAQVTNSVALWEDIDNTLKTDKNITGLLKSYEGVQVLYKGYSIKAEITPEGQFVSLKHTANVNIFVKNARVFVITCVNKSAYVNNYCTYGDFKY